MSTISKFQIVIDTQEQIPHLFEENDRCGGYVRAKLKTGDYSLVGYENIFTVERKRNLGEWCQNINQDRFERELIRLSDYQFPFLLFEFGVGHILRFPNDSGIPKYVWPKLKVNSPMIMRRTFEMQFKYPKVHMIFCENRQNAHEVLYGLFKRFWDTCQN